MPSSVGAATRFLGARGSAARGAITHPGRWWVEVQLDLEPSDLFKHEAVSRNWRSRSRSRQRALRTLRSNVRCDGVRSDCGVGELATRAGRRRACAPFSRRRCRHRSRQDQLAVIGLLLRAGKILSLRDKLRVGADPLRREVIGPLIKRPLRVARGSDAQNAKESEPSEAGEVHALGDDVCSVHLGADSGSANAMRLPPAGRPDFPPPAEITTYWRPFII